MRRRLRGHGLIGCDRRQPPDHFRVQARPVQAVQRVASARGLDWAWLDAEVARRLAPVAADAPAAP